MKYTNISRNFINLQNDLRALILKRGLQHEADGDVGQSLAGCSYTK